MAVISVLSSFIWILCIASGQTIYPDGGRNVIPVVKNKGLRIQPYNDGTVMAHVIGSAGMNFLYYFHVLGVSCENTDPEFYKIIQKDFEFCMNKTGALPPDLSNKPLGSIPKPCVDWKIRRPCYKNLADDYDECLVNRPGLVKKGTDALRFTHAFAKFICGNMQDTEAHLHDRYTKHDLVVDGVFQCFPKLQDRIVNCVKRDKVSKTLCSKFYIVHACFGKFYNDDNCQDVQPIYYMDDLFRNMTASLSCPKETEFDKPSYPGLPGEGHPTTPGWTEPEPPKKGWTAREEYSMKENPWPGERGRPWGTEDKEPFVKGSQRVGWTSVEVVNPTIDPHAHRPDPDTSWTSRRPPIWVETEAPHGGWNRSPLRGTGRGSSYLVTRPNQSYDTQRNRFRGESFYPTTSRGLPKAGIAVTRTPKDISESEERFLSTRGETLGFPSSTQSQDASYNFYSFE